MRRHLKQVLHFFVSRISPSHLSWHPPRQHPLHRAGIEPPHVERFVYGHHILSPQTGGEGGAAVEGGVFPGGAQAGGVAGVGAGHAVEAPGAFGEDDGGGHFEDFGLAVGRDLQGHAEIGAAFQLAFVHHGGGTVLQVGAAPLPVGKTVLQRFAAVVGIQIAGAGPFDGGVGESGFHPRAGAQRLPHMFAAGIEAEAALAVDDRGNAHLAADLHRQHGAFFFDIDDQRGAIPAHLAGADAQRGAITEQGAVPALCHRPAAAALAIKGDVQAHMIFRGVAAGGLVIGGEDRADEGDDGQPELSAIAFGVDIPPAVATGWNVCIEARALRIAALAKRPDKAAIGTPAPGCAEPLATQSPGSFVLLPGRRKLACHPCEARP
jgi:hypothetical protein